VGRREQVVRAALALLVVAVLVALVVRDRTRSSEEPDSPAGTTGPTVSTAEPTPEPRPEAPPPSSPSADVVPSPPEGLEALVCAEVRQPVTLRVLSFNTHRSSDSVESVAREIREVQPDVVLLQEVDRFRARSGGADQAEQLADAVGMAGSFSANLVRGSGQYGTLILSRHEIVQEGRFDLVGRPGAEPRGLQWVTLDVDGRPVRVFNTHLDAVRPRVRLRQARQVAEVVARETLPVVLGGDLNAWPTSSTVTAVSRVLTDTWAAGAGRSATSPGGRKIDYLFVGGGLRPLRSQVAASAVSDHHRLWADVRLRAPRCPGHDQG
jgi:endonuclease/exonuclease/phosphatase family metal-dependent hydrolase